MQLINGKEPLLDKIVFELRYRNGFTYLDRCGRLIHTIIDSSPEWTVDPSNPNPQGATIVSLENSCAVHIGTTRMDLAIESPSNGDPVTEEDIEGFVEQVDQISLIVKDVLGLKDFERIGCRVWYLFASDSKEEAEDWLASLECYNVNPALYKAFDGEKQALGVSLIITGSDRNYRIAFNGVERAATIDIGSGLLNMRQRQLSEHQQKLLGKAKLQARTVRNSAYPAAIDIDAFVDDPADPNCKEFVLQTMSTSLNRLRGVIGGKK